MNDRIEQELRATEVPEGKRQKRAFIYRCPPASTLHLVDKMMNLGVNTWTPTYVRTIRKRGRGQTRHVQELTALMPSFLFVHQDSMAKLEDQYIVGLHPMIFNMIHASVDEEQVKQIVIPEKKYFTNQRDQYNLAPGDMVSITDGPFKGAHGKITAIKYPHAVIAASFCRSIQVPLEWVETDDKDESSTNVV